MTVTKQSIQDDITAFTERYSRLKTKLESLDSLNLRPFQARKQCDTLQRELKHVANLIVMASQALTDWS